MKMIIGNIYKFKFTDGEGIVKLKRIDTYSMMPADYWFEYEPGSPRPLEHPDVPNHFPLPEGLLQKCIDGDVIEELGRFGQLRDPESDNETARGIINKLGLK